MYEDKTPEAIKADLLKDITSVDTREGSFTNNLVSPSATEMSKIYERMNAVIPIAFIDETSGEYIDKKASEVGITRKAGTKAEVTLTLTGTDGTAIPAGSIFLTADGLEFLTNADTTISSGRAQAAATAANVGKAYNVPAGSITTQYISIAGLSAATNAAASTGGSDPETDASLVAQYYAYLRSPSTSGNVHDYERWALEVDGVDAVKIMPLQNGPGTVGVLVAGPEMQPVDAAIISACATHIEGLRPIGPSVTVQSTSPLSINVTATVTLESSTAEAVQEKLSELLDQYMQSISAAYFKSGEYKPYTLLYNKVAYLLMGIDGIANYSDLKVNGGTTDITIAANQVPMLGTVAIS